jgi:signal peptidase I
MSILDCERSQWQASGAAARSPGGEDAIKGFLAAAGLGALAVAVLRRTLLVVEVSGSSMEPTFAGGARLLAVRGIGVRCGQVAVLAHQDRARPPGASAYLVKRIAALPGDPLPPNVRAVVGVDVVPPGQCVVLGDNADSVDSRVWGFVPRSDIVGRVVRVLSTADGRV